MILIADSGSTKTDWAIIPSHSECIYTQTTGFNPMFHNTPFIVEQIGLNPKLMEFSKHIKKVLFYGAGCSHPSRNQIIADGLTQLFPNALIEVDHDIAGAVYATCGNLPGISSIIGTGANCVYFDGQSIHHHTDALGHILGDEASGSYIGKRIARDFLYHALPLEVSEHFEKNQHFNKEEILDNVYKKPNANKYLASIAKPILEIKTHPYIQQILIEGFETFVHLHIKKIPLHNQLPLHFVGSIAFLYQEELKQVLFKQNLKHGLIIQRPIESLVDYVIKHSN